VLVKVSQLRQETSLCLGCSAIWDTSFMTILAMLRVTMVIQGVISATRQTWRNYLEEEFEFFFRCDECDHDICLACSLLNQGVLNLAEQMITDHGCALKVITNDNRGERICDGEACGKSSYGT